MRLPVLLPSLTQAKMICSSLIDTSYRSSLATILGALLAKQGSLGGNISWWLKTYTLESILAPPLPKFSKLVFSSVK